MANELDAVVIGSGPNGLAAAIALAQAGAKVQVLEAMGEPGGGLRTGELTLPGFHHDICSGCHPMAILSPYLQTLPLAQHGLEWILPPASVAHPLDDGPAVLLLRSVETTAEDLGADGPAYRRFLSPYLQNPGGLLADVLGPLGIPRHPALLARFGLNALRSATGVAHSRFREARARALFAGCAAHAVLPLEQRLTGAIGLLFLITGHATQWPVAKGGSAAIARALIGCLRALGGEVELNRPVKALADLPPARLYLFDTNPGQLAAIAAPVLPARYVRRLQRYRYGPGVFKLDWALAGPIPWKDPRCLQASTVHLGGTLDEVAAGEAAVWRGETPARPFVLLIQQSQHDPSRAPPGKHTGYAYCHVPAGSTVDCTGAIEDQVERFAPGFKDLILARHKLSAPDLERHNPNYVGGAITGGVADWGQTLARPALRSDPYSTPNPRIYLCSASTPPGGGVHGMCGYHAAKSALRRMHRLRVSALG